MNQKPINDGGPAFPVEASIHMNPTTGAATTTNAHPGMSMRDYFAAHALPSLIACGVAHHEAVLEAWELADALIAARHYIASPDTVELKDAAGKTVARANKKEAK